MKKSLLTLATALLSLCASAQEVPAPTTFDGIAATWIRTNNGGWSFGHNNGYVETSNPNAENEFIALFGFDYELPEGMKVKSATVRLVTERYKGATMIMHGYGNDFADKTTWNAESGYITPLFDQEPLATFTPKGQWNKSVSADAVSDDMANVEAWTNLIDVTAYVKTMTSYDKRVNFVLYQERGKQSSQNNFFTHEVADVVNTKTEGKEFTLSADDLKPQFIVTFIEDTDTSTDAVEPVADTYVREGNTVKRGSEGSMEIKLGAGTMDAPQQQFYGLMSFKLPADVVDGTCEVTSARLRLVCTQNKGDRTMNIYKYPSAFDEANAIWDTEKDNVAVALKSEPIAVFSVNGQGPWSMTDARVSEEYSTAEAWTSYIDLTEYLKANPADLNIMLGRNMIQGDAMRIATKEVSDIENTAAPTAPFTFKAEDLKPMLYISYAKKDVSAGVDDIVVDENAPVEYYNLQGIRVENPTSGLYIKRQGNKAVKILVR